MLAIIVDIMKIIKPENFRFIAIENQHPFSVVVYSMSDDMIESGKLAWRTAFKQWKKYKQTGFGDMVIDAEAAKLNELNTEVIDSFDGDFSKIFKHNTKDLEVLSIEDLEQELNRAIEDTDGVDFCLLYASPSQRDRTRDRMPSCA